MNITVAGAGAGKTTSMAQKVLERFDTIEDGKIVYAVTYTNAARNKIREKVKEQRGTIPNRLFIETIHAFLLREIIFPFHHLLYDEYYTTSSQIPLHSNRIFRANKIKELKENKIIHVDEVTKTAKWIVSRKSDDRKSTREKRARISAMIARYLDSVFVDEAQDMDEHFMEVLRKLSENIGIVLVGDPKQDLNGHNAFRQLINDFPQSVKYISLNRRCPTPHISLSNTFIPEVEAQVPLEEKEGILNFIFESVVAEQIDNLISEYDYSYIIKKNSKFITNVTYKDEAENNLYYELRMLLKKSTIKEKDLDPTVYMESKFIKREMDKKSNYEIMKILEHTHALSLTKQDYGKMCSALDLLRTKPTESGVLVHSIDRIKGLEGDKCLFILTPDIALYLFKDKLEQNKMMNYLYVALTRAKFKLTILVTTEVEKRYGIKRLQEKFYKLSITEGPSN